MDIRWGVLPQLRRDVVSSVQELPDDFEAALRVDGDKGVGPTPVATALQEAACSLRGPREEAASLFVALLRSLGFLARSVRRAVGFRLVVEPRAVA